MKICGPNLSICGLIISTWGIIQLVFMAIFYHLRSVALSEDIPGIEHDRTFDDIDKFYAAANQGYELNAINCWIAACLYVFTLLFSCHQFYANSHSSLNM